MGQVVVVPNHADLPETEPVIFLAGPIQGTRDWQSKAIREIRTFSQKVHVASPRAAQFNGDFDGQVAWETTWLTRAASCGCIMVWCAREAEHRCDRAYAQTTRFEAGEWMARSKLQDIRVVIGFEHGFTGERYLRARLRDTYRNIAVCSTLKQTCAVAVEQAGIALPKAISLMHQED